MSSVASATAWALVHFLWQGTLIGLITGGVLALLERRKASTRYVAAVGSLLVMAALPIITAVQLVPLQIEMPSEVAATVVSPASPRVPTAAPEPPSPGAMAIRTFGGSLLPWVLGLWLAGVAALASYHLGGWRLARRLSRQGRPAAAAITSLGLDLSRRFGIRRWVAFLESSAVSVPTVIGWLRPVVLVPASALAGLSPVQLEAILAHELAHVRRHDYLVNLLQTAVETLLFYHPAVWWVSAQVRRERENCCDDLAVAVCGDRLSYARALVDLEGLRTTPRLALAASGGSLSERVRRLVGAPGRHPRRFWAAGLLALALLPAGAVVQLACAHDSAKASRNASTGKASDPSRRQGRWSAKADGKDIRFRITLYNRGWGSWMSVDDFRIHELKGLTVGSDIRFELRRDAGTFRFRGSWDGRRGHGAATFQGNPAFAELIGLPRTSSRLLELAIQDVSIDFVREMTKLGIGDLPPQAAATRKGSPLVFVKELVGLQRRPSLVEELAQLRIHGITPEYVRGMQEAGYPRLQTWQLVQLRIHGIEPDYVKGLRQSGYRHVMPYRIVEFQIHGITLPSGSAASRRRAT